MRQRKSLLNTRNPQSTTGGLSLSTRRQAKPAFGRPRGCRAVHATAKAMESVLVPGVGADGPSGVLGVERANGHRGNPGEPSRPRRLRGGGKRCPTYNRRTREVVVAVERQSERVVVLGGRESRLHGEGPALHRSDR